MATLIDRMQHVGNPRDVTPNTKEIAIDRGWTEVARCHMVMVYHWASMSSVAFDTANTVSIQYRAK
jgi:hypothetical protein